MAKVDEKFSALSGRYKNVLRLIFSFAWDFFSHLADFYEIFAKKWSKSLQISTKK